MNRLPDQRPHAILFDYGGVFTGPTFSAVDVLAHKLGTSAAVLFELFLGPYDTDTDHPWHRLERGEIDLASADGLITKLCRDAGVAADLTSFLVAMAPTAGVRDEMVALAREVRAAGLRTALVTNNLAEFRDHWRRSLPLDDLFDVVVDSSEVGMRKPDLRIFTLTLARLGIADPTAALFLDDFHGNVTAARRAGLRGLLVEPDPAAAIAEVRRLVFGSRAEAGPEA